MSDNLKNNNGDSPLDNLFWREELLQIIYWLQGEEIIRTVTAKDILPLLNNIDESALDIQLQKLVDDEYLQQDGLSYSFTTSGKKEGGKLFAQAFDGMQKAGHGDCGPDCEFCYGPEGEKLENCVHNCTDSHTHQHLHS